jgi:hypothetical protein
MELQDRMAQMGHGEARMTVLYTKESLDRRRRVVDIMASKILEHSEAEKRAELMERPVGPVV